MMIFVIKSFGGEVCWDGEGSMYDKDDSRITHFVIDRPTTNMKLNPKVVYIQPQWVCDCANWRVLIPPTEYAPENEPPPHLSPFVGADDDGYTPEYAKTLLKLQEEARAIRTGVPLVKMIEGDDEPIDEEMEAANEEKRYRKELEAEIKGVSYSKSLEKKEVESDEESEDDASEDEDEDEDEDENEEDSDEDSDSVSGSGEPKSRLTMDMALSEKDKIMRDQLAKGTDEEQMKKMSYMLLPRKKRELYKAMQIGIAKKEKRAAELTRLAEEHKEKKRLQAEGKSADVSAPKRAKKAPAKGKK
jgi:pescadillo protein